MKRINRRMRADMTAEQFENFRAEMRRLRKANKLTATALAELVGCSNGHIGVVERGEKYPSEELAEDIANIFNTTVEEMCGGKEANETTSEAYADIMRNFGTEYRRRRIERGFAKAEVAGFTGITKECLADFEDGRCSLGDSVLEKLNRLYAVKTEVETVEVVKEVAAPCPISLDLIDKVLAHITDLGIDESEKRDMFRELSGARTQILERQIFG